MHSLAIMEGTHQEAGHIPWNEYIQDNLLSREAGLTGVVLLTREGVCVYRYGTLANEEKEDWTPLIQLFSNSDEDVVSSLSLKVDYKRVKFVPFKKTLASLYGVSEGDVHRLVACSFPLGVLVCINQPPTTLNNAVKIVESFCANIRTNT